MTIAVSLSCSGLRKGTCVSCFTLIDASCALAALLCFSGIAQVERCRDSAVTPFEGIVVLEVFPQRVELDKMLF